jgi:hypothetical protein
MRWARSFPEVINACTRLGVTPRKAAAFPTGIRLVIGDFPIVFHFVFIRERTFSFARRYLLGDSFVDFFVVIGAEIQRTVNDTFVF